MRGWRAGGREEREESRGSEQYSSGSPSKSFNPNGEAGFLCGERGREKGECTKGERERERHGRRETRGKCEKRKERSGLGDNFFPTLPLSFPPPSFFSPCTACIHLPFMQQAILR